MSFFKKIINNITLAEFTCIIAQILRCDNIKFIEKILHYCEKEEVQLNSIGVSHILDYITNSNMLSTSIHEKYIKKLFKKTIISKNEVHGLLCNISKSYDYSILCYWSNFCVDAYACICNDTDSSAIKSMNFYENIISLVEFLYFNLCGEDSHELIKKIFNNINSHYLYDNEHIILHRILERFTCIFQDKYDILYLMSNNLITFNFVTLKTVKKIRVMEYLFQNKHIYNEYKKYIVNSKEFYFEKERRVAYYQSQMRVSFTSIILRDNAYYKVKEMLCIEYLLRKFFCIQNINFVCDVKNIILQIVFH